MRILLVHNYYQQPGGEDEIFATEAALLANQGHEVLRYTLHNNQIPTFSSWALLKATLWNNRVYQELRTIISQARPALAHFHNTFPLISPAAYYAAKAEGIPVVQSLHNYRLLCPGATFYREGKVCESCLTKAIPWPGLKYGCYRESRTATSAVSALLMAHRALQTWTAAVDLFIVAMTDFARMRFIQGGLPAEKLIVKPNFIHPDPGAGAGAGNYALFVGRLAQEKGIEVLLSAWQQIGSRLPLKLAGDGPLAATVAAAGQQTPGVEWLGRQGPAEVYRLMRDAKLLIVPSLWYEGMPRTIVESFAAGTPVLASNLGAMEELIIPGRTGWHFRPNDAADLAAQLKAILAHPDQLPALRQTTRAEFEAKYTATQNYQQLMQIYQRALSTQTVSTGRGAAQC